MIHDHFIRLSHAYGPQQFALIGANDGITDDPIYPFVLDYGWKGVAVEPVRAYFEQLRQHYERKPVRCLNIAVHESAREMDFFYLEDRVNRPLPAYAKGIGSFDKAQVRQLAKEVPDGESYIKSDRIACLTLCEVLSQSGTGSIDVIVIDTEGYDSQVVRMINFNRWTPRAIVFEHKLLNQFDLESTLAELKLNGFEWTADQADVLAYRNI